MDDVRHAVDTKRTLIHARGYRRIEMWECQLQTLKKTNPDVAIFVADLGLQDPLAAITTPSNCTITSRQGRRSVTTISQVCTRRLLSTDAILSGIPRSCSNKASRTRLRTSGWASAPSYHPTLSTIPPAPPLPLGQTHAQLPAGQVWPTAHQDRVLNSQMVIRCFCT